MANVRRLPLAVIASLFFALSGCAHTRMVEGQRISTVLDESEVNIPATYRIEATCADPESGRTGTCIGTGFVIHESGILLTNRHVIENDDGSIAEAITIQIQEHDGPIPYSATVLARSDHHDLAVIKVMRRFSKTVTLADAEEALEVAVRNRVYAVGFPFDNGKDTVSGGISQMRYAGSRRTPAGFVRLRDDGDNVVTNAGPQAEADGPYTLKDDLKLDINCAPGSSGSGVFLEDGGDLVGVVKVLLIPDRRHRNFWIAAEPVAHIREFLDENKIPYHD